MSPAKARSERRAGVTAAQLAEVQHPEILAALLARATKTPRPPGAMDPANEIDRRMFRQWLTRHQPLLDLDYARVDLIHVLRDRAQSLEARTGPQIRIGDESMTPRRPSR